MGYLRAHTLVDKLVPMLEATMDLSMESWMAVSMGLLRVTWMDLLMECLTAVSMECVREHWMDL